MRVEALEITAEEDRREVSEGMGALTGRTFLKYQLNLQKLWYTTLK